MELKWLVMSVRAVALSLCAVMAFAGTASAELIVAESGNRGSWDIVDEDGMPGGRCGYGAENASGVAALKWIRLFGPSVKAFNRTSAVDQQKVSFQVKVMRRTGSGSWSVAASSGRQTLTARDNAWTTFDPIRVYVNGAANQEFRAMAVLRWMRNGSVNGMLKANIYYYSAKWTVGAPGYQFEDVCWGVAD
jgi:hypothetical protein